MHKLLAEMLEERIASIEDALTQLEQRDDAQAGLHNLQARLLRCCTDPAGGARGRAGVAGRLSC
jgi:Flp pilus assembly protein TadB